MAPNATPAPRSDKGRRMQHQATAVILCLGEATRMRPMTLHQPKALLPFCGRPLIEYTLEALLQDGLRDIVIVGGPEADALSDYEAWGRARKLGIRVIRRGLEFGSAGVVASILESGLAVGDDLLIVYGDSLLSLDFVALLDAHRRHVDSGGAVTMGCHRPPDLAVEGETRSRYGVVWLDDRQRVTRFVEKPPTGHVSGGMAHAGVFVLDRRAVRRIPASRPLDFSADVFQKWAQVEASPVFGFDLHPGFRFDIGTPADYRARQLEVLRGEIALDHVPRELVRPIARSPQTATRDAAVMLGCGCRIAEDVVFRGANVIGDRVSVGSGSQISNSVLLADTWIGDSVCISDAVIAEGCRIGPNVRIVSGTVLGDHSVVTSNRTAPGA